MQAEDIKAAGRLADQRKLAFHRSSPGLKLSLSKPVKFSSRGHHQPRPCGVRAPVQKFRAWNHAPVFFLNRRQQRKQRREREWQGPPLPPLTSVQKASAWFHAFACFEQKGAEGAEGNRVIPCVPRFSSAASCSKRPAHGFHAFALLAFDV